MLTFEHVSASLLDDGLQNGDQVATGPAMPDTAAASDAGTPIEALGKILELVQDPVAAA